jgi:hypothetical protein
MSLPACSATRRRHTDVAIVGEKKEKKKKKKKRHLFDSSSCALSIKSVFGILQLEIRFAKI